MKKEYTIGEICDLYDIGPDSMRYYERMGLINPKRRQNGYRIYTLEEISRLNIIKDLRKLGFSVRQIKEYLEERSIETTKILIEKEISVIKEEIDSLKRVEDNLKRRLRILKSIDSIDGYGEIQLKEIGPRKMVLVKERTSKDEEVDLAFRKLESMNEERALLFGNKDMGVFISHIGLERGVYNQYDNVFFFVDDGEENYDEILPESLYANLVYRGAYNQSHDYINKMLKYIEKKGYSINGNAIEIYRVDVHETAKEEEFITEIQIPISQMGK